MKRQTWALALVATAAGYAWAPVYAQSFPAGVQGTWKIVKKLEVPPSTVDCLGGLPNAQNGSTVAIGEHSLLLNGQGTNDAQPNVRTVTAAEFVQQHLSGSEASFKRFGLRTSNLEVITPGSPASNTNSAPFEMVIVKSPSTLLFEKCGQYFEAAHAGGFKAPKLPER